MEWTAQQIEAMRAGRPVHGATDKGGTLTLLRTGAETSGEYSLLYFKLSPGYSIPAHYHTLYTETFKILDGQLPGLYGKGRITAKPGDEVVIRPGTPHGWGPLSEGEVTALVEIRPAHAGVEKWLLMMHDAWADGILKPNLAPKSFVAMCLAGVEMDTRAVGRDRIFNPIIRAVAWFARKAGVERRLEARYYHPSTGDVATTG